MKAMIEAKKTKALTMAASTSEDTRCLRTSGNHMQAHDAIRCNGASMALYTRVERDK